MIQLIGVQALKVLNTCTAQLLEQHFRQLVVGLGNDLASVTIHDVASHHATNEEVFWHAHMGRTGLLQLTCVASGDALVFGHHDLA